MPNMLIFRVFDMGAEVLLQGGCRIADELAGVHLLPPGAFTFDWHRVTGRARLPMLYLHRGIHGAWKRILDP